MNGFRHVLPRAAAVLTAVCILFSALSFQVSGLSETPLAAPSVSSSPQEYLPGEDDGAALAAELNRTQRSSIQMLNWLSCLTEQIIRSGSEPLYLEEAYSLLINETCPDAVDAHTQEHIKAICQAISRLQAAEAKRERIDYLHEQGKASAIRSAGPIPAIVLTSVKSFSLTTLATTILYMAVNFVTSYSSSASQTDLQYLQEGWSLDDEARSALETIRSEAFDYMLDIVREYQLPGSLVLTEEAVQQFAAWRNNANITRRIQFLESNQETYRAFGPYWLALAESYFLSGDYTRCLSAVRSYEALDTRIFRHDLEYAGILPLAIASAQETMSGQDYIDFAQHCAEQITANISSRCWELRYFAAQTYLELYQVTRQQDYLLRAYQEVTDNVNYLLDTQLALNAAYLAPVEEIPVPKNASKETAKAIKAENKLRREKRARELPPVYEPLLLQVDFLFTLSDALDLSAQEQERLNQLLHPDGEKLFLVDMLDAACQFPPQAYAGAEENESVLFRGKQLTVPAVWLSESAVITVTVHGEETVTFSDWSCVRVTRKTEGEIASFQAVLESTAASAYRFQPGERVEIVIQPHPDTDSEVYRLSFTAENAKTEWYQHLGFWNSDVTFIRQP